LVLFLSWNWSYSQSWYVVATSDGLDEETEDVFFLNPDTGYVAGWRVNNISKTTDGGLTWTPTTGLGITCLSAVFFTDANHGFATGCMHSVAKTTNGGSTWVTGTLPNLNTGMGIFFPSADTGFIVSNVGIIFKTTDAGSNWVNIYQNSNPDIQLSLNEIFFPSPNIGYAVGGARNYFMGIDSVVILKTTDNGSTWIDKSPDIPGLELQSVYFINDTTGYAVGQNYILKTMNGGDNWTSVSDDTWWLWDIAFKNENTGYVVGNSIILETTDGGLTWQSSSNNEMLTAICFSNNVGYISTYSSKILKNTTVSGYEFMGTNNSTKVYPNPVANELSIELDRITDNTVFEILNTFGQVVLKGTLVDKKTIINTSSFSPGVYLLKLENGKTIDFKKIIKA
jgi:photosystem II stability/assembly factor-like uncharacterized protein